ncbi:MAG: Nramp family divalent metal transporter [Thaumarchaeota archaeon]|nr:Nramp family divalent metal transporter [Nitrososphaerota archaeon]
MSIRVGAGFARSVREFFTYLGPTLIVSMAYMDPGNYGTAIQAGSTFGYTLVWSVWAASAFAMILQYMSGKLGIASNQSLPEMVRGSLRKRRYVIPYWLSAELAAAATDLAEYLGTVIALNILFNVPLLYAAIFGAFDVILLLALTARRFRLLEYLFMLFISVISFGFLYEVIVVKPSLGAILTNSLPLTGTQLNALSILTVVGIIGATVMPHALFVHSSLTKTRAEAKSIIEKRQLMKMHRNEVIVILSIAALVNVAILVVSAAVLYPASQQCLAFNPASSICSIVTVNQAVNIMAPLFGALSATVFAITLLFSGIASSATGTLAGQAIMEGLLGRRINVNLRRLVTRVVNVFPTTVAILIGLDPLALLVYSQVLLSLLIPLPMVPLVIYTSRKKVMGEFVNRNATIVVAGLVATLIIALNIYLVYTSV